MQSICPATPADGIGVSSACPACLVKREACFSSVKFLRTILPGCQKNREKPIIQWTSRKTISPKLNDPCALHIAQREKRNKETTSPFLYSWLKIEVVHDIEKVKYLYELEQGEAEVIVLAKEKNIEQVLIDEKVARLQAKVLGLEVIGTLGILLKAKKKRLLTSIKPSITKILENGIWIKDEIVKGILKEAGES